MDVRWGEQKEVDRKRRKTIDDIMVAGGRELIDTLWNVNAEKRTLCTGNKTGINRYIMECKFDYLDEIWTGKMECKYGKELQRIFL